VKIARGDPDVRALIAPLLEAGANPDTVNFEVCAFSAFATWAATSTAVQRNKISAETFELFQRTFWEQLDRSVGGTDFDLKCLTTTGLPLFLFVSERVDKLIESGKESTEISIAVAEQMCEWLGVEDSSYGTRILIRKSFFQTTEAAYDIIRATKIIS
jgi:hypothetical protein